MINKSPQILAETLPKSFQLKKILEQKTGSIFHLSLYKISE
jgi:hypothetical protein